ncbi:MAG: T9SS type A sorting domain-containing protein, partial [Chitinophagales bacterium]
FSSAASIAQTGSTVGTVYGMSAGVATITYSYNTGCSVTKQISIVNCSNEVTIFPNPVKNKLIIQADTALYHSYSIINCIGQVIIHRELTQTLTEIDTTSWSAGIYIVRLWGTLTYISKLVKE